MIYAKITIWTGENGKILVSMEADNERGTQEEKFIGSLLDGTLSVMFSKVIGHFKSGAMIEGESARDFTQRMLEKEPLR